MMVRHFRDLIVCSSYSYCIQVPLTNTYIRFIKFFCAIDAVFQFSMEYYGVNEDSGVVSICLQLINGTLTESIIIQVMVSDSNGMSGCKKKTSIVSLS